MNIYVGNLAYAVSESDLSDAFGQYGSVSNVSIIKHRDSGESKGFGFVEMDNQADGEQAVENLNGKDIKGRPIRVSEARPKAS